MKCAFSSTFLVIVSENIFRSIVANPNSSKSGLFFDPDIADVSSFPMPLAPVNRWRKVSHHTLGLFDNYENSSIIYEWGPCGGETQLSRHPSWEEVARDGLRWVVNENTGEWTSCWEWRQRSHLPRILHSTSQDFLVMSIDTSTPARFSAVDGNIPGLPRAHTLTLTGQDPSMYRVGKGFRRYRCGYPWDKW